MLTHEDGLLLSGVLHRLYIIEAEKFRESENKHNALVDAVWNEQFHNYLIT